jgi:hypothetical protein
MRPRDHCRRDPPAEPWIKTVAKLAFSTFRSRGSPAAASGFPSETDGAKPAEPAIVLGEIADFSVMTRCPVRPQTTSCPRDRFPTAGVSDALAAYTIGFAKLEIRDLIEDASGAGPGTLVLVGKVRGILTVAHVEALFSNGTVSVERSAGRLRPVRLAPTDYPDFTLPGNNAPAAARSGGSI